jgi:nucleoside-diphosphate-sugar epimerase
MAVVDALVHVAYDFTARGWPEVERTNVRGSIALVRAAVAAGVRRLVFLSSMAAYDGCRSVYGRGKLAVEAEVLRQGGYVVRPGTIHGGEVGGLFRSLGNLVAKLPILPVPDLGNQIIYLVHIEDLIDLVERLLRTDLPERDRLVTAACPAGMKFREILGRIARRQGRRIILLPMPRAFLLKPLRAVESALGSKLPVHSDSLISLLNPNPKPDFRLPAALVGAQFRPFD